MELSVTINSLHRDTCVTREHSISIETIDTTVNSAELTTTQKFSCVSYLINDNCKSESLLWYIRKEHRNSVLLFLKFSGILWIDPNDPMPFQILCGLWFIYSKIVYLFSFIYLGQILHESNVPQNTTKMKFQFMIVPIASIFQILSILPSIHHFSTRLNSKCLKIELPHFYSQLLYCILFYVFALPTGLMFFAYNIEISINTKTQLFYLYSTIFAEIAITGILAVNLLFLYVDAKISINLLNEAINEAKLHTLTLENFCLIRQEIARRVNASFWMNACLVLVAIGNVLAFNIVLYTLSTASPILYKLTIYEVLIFIKEFLFLGIEFYVTSQVNEKADELTSVLAKQSWNKADDTSLEVMRMSIYISAIDNPISFPLAGYRYKRIDILIQLGTIGISSLIPIIQSLTGEQQLALT